VVRKALLLSTVGPLTSGPGLMCAGRHAWSARGGRSTLRPSGGAHGVLPRRQVWSVRQMRGNPAVNGRRVPHLILWGDRGAIET
jgi:hypothetical protein